MKDKQDRGIIYFCAPYYEPGTINIILITNMELSPRAMARAVISITEAKSAVMADLDIRSSDDPLNLQATY